MKKFILFLILLGFAGGGTWYYFQQKKAKEAKAAQNKFTPAAVTLRTLNRTVESTGTVSPENRLQIKPPIAGRLEKLLVDEGEDVVQGQLIAWVSSTERASLLDIARATSEEELKYWEEIYKATPLLSPLSGTVIVRNLEPGQTVTASDAVIVIADRLIVVGQVDETDIGSIVPGQTVNIQLDAYPDSAFQGKVDSIAYDSKMVSNVTMYEVDVRPENIPDFARSGMTATLTFIIERREKVPVVPTSAIQFRDRRNVVLIPAADGAEPGAVPVRTGISENSFTEILEGLEPGDAILVPQLSLRREAAGNPFMPGGNNRNRSSSSQQRR
ncbi:MAG: efflux RND transporter periplasmic adaptor subunit [Kiritimatiellales bacterium]